MRWFRRPQSWKLLAINYVGGLGYYAQLLAITLTLLGALATFGAPSLLEQPTQPTSTAAADLEQPASPERSLGSTILITIISLPIIVTVSAFVLAIPYIIGRYMGRGMRWLLDVMGISVRSLSLLTCKFTMLFIFGMSMWALYSISSKAEVWVLLFNVVAMTCGVAAVLFIIQHFVARLAKIPADDII